MTPDFDHSNLVRLPWPVNPDLLPNNARTFHRQVQAKHEKEERTATNLHLRSLTNGGTRFYIIDRPCRLTLDFRWPGKLKKNGEPNRSVRLPDLTNLIGAFKPTLDGFQDAGILLDDALVCEVQAKAEMDWGGKGWMTVWLIPMKA